MGVRTPSVPRVPTPIGSFVGVAARAQTYRNLLYLSLSFPLAVLYSMLLVFFGLSMGAGLLFAAVSVAALVGLLVVSDRLLVFERWLAARLVGEDLPLDRAGEPDDVWDRIRDPLTDVGTWLGLGYITARIVVGFVLMIALPVIGVVSWVMITAPFYYSRADLVVEVPEPVHFSISYVVQFWDGVETITLPVTITTWEVTTLSEAVALSALGVLVALVALHLCNALAAAHGKATKHLIRPRPIDLSGA